MRAEDVASVFALQFPEAELRGLERLKGGVSAEVYRADLRMPDGAGQSVVFRAAGKSGLGGAQEYELLAALHVAGVPTPRPICFDDSRSRVEAPYVLMAFVDGAPEIPPERADERIPLMAQALAAIHELPTVSLPPLPPRVDPLPELLAFLPAGAAWQSVRDLCGSLGVTKFSGAPVLLHGDFWPQNLIWRDGRIAAILDWEDAALGDPLSDLASALLELKYLFEDRLAHRFEAAYRRHLPVDARRLALWQIYVAAAAQHFMGAWGLEPSREDRMRRTALRQIREAAEILGGGAAGPEQPDIAAQEKCGGAPEPPLGSSETH